MFQYCSLFLFAVIKNASSNQKPIQSDRPITHDGIVCDGCRDSGKYKFQPRTPHIIGIRYKCLNCAGMVDVSNF